MNIQMLLEKIDERQLFVPAFQREFVWKRDNAKELIDSLIKQYPIGTLLLWETSNPPELKGPYAYDKRQGAVRLLLDGQQRVTVLYMLFRNQVPPYYTEEEILKDPRGLYVNLESGDLSYYVKAWMENNPLWRDITRVLNKHVRSRDVISELEKNGEEVSRERGDRIDDITRAIENIGQREFPEQTIPAKASIREAINIFYKVNASGVALTDAELALAQISGYWPEARDRFKAKLRELEKVGFVFNLDFLVYALLGCLYHQGSEMHKLHAESNKEALIAIWEQLESKVLDYVVSLLRSHAYVDHTKEINSVYALVPIVVYCYDKEGDYLTEWEIRKMVKWFYYSQIKRRYVSQLPQKLDRDLRLLLETDNPFDELVNIIGEDNRLTIEPRDFVGHDIKHPLFHMMKWYFKSRNAKCLTTGVELRQTMGKNYQLENDHIFPYQLLKKQGYTRDNRVKYQLAQELTNRAIITQVANRKKSNKAAKDYLRGVKERFPDALELQCIPEDEELWQIENYEQFLQKRRDMLAKHLNDFLESITATEKTEAPLLVEELIDQGESEDLEFKSSLRWDVREQKVNKELEKVIVKTVTAFANSQGGTLLIGVDDDGEILGLEADYTSLSGDKDKFELHLRNVLNQYLGEAFVSSKVKVDFPVVQDTEICRIEIDPATRPLYLKLKNKHGQPEEKFYVRSGNSSQELELSEANEFISENF